jgi:hypothetical protein
MDLHKFAGGAAHRLALSHGYVDAKTGQELWLKAPDKIAFKVELDANGTAKVNEINLDDKSVIGTHVKGTAFGVDEKMKGFGEYTHAHVNLEHHTIATPETAPEQGNGSSEKYFTGTPKEYYDNLGKPQSLTDHDKIKHPTDTLNQQYENKIDGSVLHQTTATPQTDAPSDVAQPEQIIQTKPIQDSVVLQSWLKTHPEFTHSNLTSEKLTEIIQTHDHNLSKIFPRDTITEWNKVATQKATKFLDHLPKEAPKEGDHPFFSYIRKLHKIAGKPKGGFLSHKETLKEYTARALQLAAKRGELEKLNLE